MPPFFGPVSSFLSLKSNIGTGLVFGGQVNPALIGTEDLCHESEFEGSVEVNKS
jgi:hypothetical protein